MPNLRFNHVFAGLMAMAFLTTFVLGERSTGNLQSHFQGLFTWISNPVLRMSGAVNNRIEERTKAGEDPRSLEALRRENDALRVAVVSLGSQLESLRRLNAERDLVGMARDLSIPAHVIAADAGTRDSVTLDLSSGEGAKVGSAVVSGQNVAGRIVSAGATGSQVRLVTDVASRIQCTFGRFQKTGDRLEFLSVPLKPQIVEGRGNGNMVVTNVTEQQVKDAGLKVDDWAVVSDPDWPLNLQGYRVGHVTDIRPARAALFVEIWLRPEVNLETVRDVMVMKATASPAPTGGRR